MMCLEANLLCDNNSEKLKRKKYIGAKLRMTRWSLNAQSSPGCGSAVSLSLVVSVSNEAL